MYVFKYSLQIYKFTQKPLCNHKNLVNISFLWYAIVCSLSVGRRFESGSLRNGGMLILCIYFAVGGMPIEMYGESWIAGLLTSDDVMLFMAGFETTRGI